MDLTPLAISVLGLLVERSMHPYEMHQVLLERHRDRIVKVRPGSLYHTVERLQDAGLVVATGTDRSGNRPERTTYAVTEDGRTALAARTRELLRTPVNEYPTFLVALAEAHNVDRSDLTEDLRIRLANLNGTVAELDAWMAGMRGLDVPEPYWLAIDYQRTLCATERDWLSRTLERLESKELTWPRP